MNLFLFLAAVIAFLVGHPCVGAGLLIASVICVVPQYRG